MPVALDATYSVGRELSGVGQYCREVLYGLCRLRPDVRFLFCYRPHRLARSFREALPSNASRRLLLDRWSAGGALFHGLNQRLPRTLAGRAVSTFHDLFVMTSEYSSAEFRRRFTRQAEDAARRSDLIICVSRFTAQQVETLLHVEPSRLRVIPHGVHPARGASPHTGAREPIVLHVGAIQERKNLVRLVRAFAATPPEWRLVLAGSQGYEAARVLEAVAASPARGRIELPGYLPASELESLYSRASILAFPSLDEGFGMPVLEAMARGIPVITSNRSALPEVAGDAALLIEPADEDQLAGALLELTGSQDRRAELGRKGVERVREFSWERSVERTWEVYAELI